MEECIPNPRVEIEIYDSDLIENINDFLYSLKETERNIFIKRYWYCESIKDLAFYYKF